MTRGRPFRLATDLDHPAIDAATIYDSALHGVATCNAGGDFYLIGGRFLFEGDQAWLLFDALPAIVHVRQGSDQVTDRISDRVSDQAAILRWSLEQLLVELERGAPGCALMADHLAQIMLLQVLRLWLACGRPTGWLGAIADPRLTRALNALHAEPARRWTVTALAGRAGMSRTAFAERFRAIVGQPPLDYLTGWRMQLAADRLRRSGESVATIAYSVGYESETAFGTAFRRRMACTPMQYRRRMAALLLHRTLG